MDMMIGGGLPGSSEFVLLSTFVCFVGQEEAPIVSQTHACCWVVKKHQIYMAQIPYKFEISIYFEKKLFN